MSLAAGPATCPACLSRVMRARSFPTATVQTTAHAMPRLDNSATTAAMKASIDSEITRAWPMGLWSAVVAVVSRALAD